MDIDLTSWQFKLKDGRVLDVLYPFVFNRDVMDVLKKVVEPLKIERKRPF